MGGSPGEALAAPRALPVHGAPGPVQDLQVTAVGQTPVDAGLLRLPGLPFGVVHADSTDLGRRGKDGELSGGRGERAWGPSFPDADCPAEAQTH